MYTHPVFSADEFNILHLPLKYRGWRDPNIENISINREHLTVE